MGSMLSKIVSLSLAALAAGQVQIEGSPEWQAWRNAELAWISPSVGPTPVNFAQAQLNHIAPAPGPTPVNYAQSVLNHQAAALNFVAGGRKKRQVSVVGSPEWQAWKQAELNFIAPSVGPTPNNNFAQAQLNHLANAAAYVASGAGRKKRQVSVVGVCLSVCLSVYVSLTMCLCIKMLTWVLLMMVKDKKKVSV